MTSSRDQTPAEHGRRETELERVDRNLGELLQELRVLFTGVQLLFGFLLIVPFSAHFSRVAGWERYLYFAVLITAAAAAGLLIAPTALHRLLFRQGDKPHLVETANRMAIAGIAFLTLAMTGILTLISGVLFGWITGGIVAALGATFFGGLWFGLGLRRRVELNRLQARQAGEDTPRGGPSAPSGDSVPDFIATSDLLSDAYRFAERAHEGPRSHGDTGIQHPLQVATLLHQAQCPEHVLAAALLHDVVEDTTTGEQEIAARFGPHIAQLVAHLSEDPDIREYTMRKAELRDQVRSAGRSAAAIFVADKLANAQAINKTGEPVPAEKLDHYQRTLDELADAYSDLPFAGEAQQLVSRLEQRREAD
jgi:hypothetical protein